MGGFMSRIPNPLKHAKPEPEILTGESHSVEELTEKHAQMKESFARLGQKDAEMHLRTNQRKIELAKNLKVTCSVEAPQGWQDVPTDMKHFNYKSGPLKVVFTIDENGKTRQFETKAEVGYQTPTYFHREDREQMDRIGVKPKYGQADGIDKLPWGDEASRLIDKQDGYADNDLKNEIAADAFFSAINKMPKSPIPPNTLRS